MSIFQEATNMQAYLKAGLMGFAGTGKSYTATQIAKGLVLHMRELGLEAGDRPVMFLDTETGSDWIQPLLAEADIKLYTSKTRAFVNLIPAIEEAERSGSVLIIDSITHFWRELTESYVERKGRKRGLQFNDWAWLKQTWGKFTDKFINSNAHIIMCGRAGYEYDFFEQDDGKKELEKTGIKMKAEGETGFEPSILILMEKHMEMETKHVYRTASIMKDRSDRIDGQTFRNPTFEDFLPHIRFLNLGGSHMGVDTSADSSGIITRDGKSQWQYDKEQKEIILDEIQSLLVAHYPSTSKDDKLTKMELLNEVFGTRSWKRVEQQYDLQTIKTGWNKLSMKLDGKPAFGEVPEEDLDDGDDIPMGEPQEAAPEAAAEAREEPVKEAPEVAAEAEQEPVPETTAEAQEPAPKGDEPKTAKPALITRSQVSTLRKFIKEKYESEDEAIKDLNTIFEMQIEKIADIPSGETYKQIKEALAA